MDGADRAVHRDLVIVEHSPVHPPQVPPSAPTAPAKWYCRLCRVDRFDHQVDVHYLDGRRYAMCRSCWNTCISTPAMRAEPEDPGPESIASGLIDALGYPLRRGAWLHLMMGAVTFGIIDLATRMSLFRLALWLPVLIYAWAYFIRITGDAAVGRRTLSDWPDLSDLWDDVIGPGLRGMMIVAACFAPAVVDLVRHMSFESEGDARLSVLFAWVFGVGQDPLFGALQQNTDRWPVIGAWMLLGCALAPIGLSLVAVGGRLASAHPFLVLRSIARAPWDYGVVALAWTGVAGLWLGAQVFLWDQPLWLGLFTPVWFYLAIVLSYLSGRWAWVHRHRLGWYRIEESISEPESLL